MGIDTLNTAELVHSLQEALDKSSKGIRDPNAMDQALKELERGREELRKKIGTVEAAVDLIHDARNQ